jgi:hypothetical protein
MALANILPGLREIRAPLAAGYLWLFFGYLVFGAPERRDATGLEQKLIDLGDALSPVGLAVAASFVAYLVGSLSLAAARMLGEGLSSIVQNLRSRDLPSMRLSERGQSTLEEIVGERYVAGLIGSVGEARRLAREIVEDLDLVRTRLMGREPELFAEVDRLSAEADLRAAITLPLAGLAIAIPVLVQVPSTPHAVSALVIAEIAICLVAFIGLEAAESRRKANDRLLEAVYLGRVASPAIERWERSLTLPA